MSYTIYVGNAELYYSAEYNEISIDVAYVTHPDAPNQCKYTKNSNCKQPGYSQWYEFCKSAGISELFYIDKQTGYSTCNDDFHREYPLFDKHPGIAVITNKDYEYIKASRIRRESINGRKEPGFWDDEKIDNGKDSVLARLLWLEFWFKWAIDNCQYPVIKNS